MIPSDERARLQRALEARDYFRRPPRVERGTHKEWLHFAVYAEGLDVLVNYSIVDDIRPRAPQGAELYRLTCIVREGAWDGDVDSWPQHSARVRGGSLDLSFGPNEVRFEGGAYLLRAKLKNRPIEVDLVLEPDAFPTEANNVNVEDGPPIHWMVAPRLRASGTVKHAGRTHVLVDAPAYHDHNWGSFGWGRNFAWEWGYTLPRDKDNPWTLVFVRLTDRGHRRMLMQGIFLWRAGSKERVFRDDEVELRHEGLLRPRSLLKIPRVMGLVSPGTAVDVPRRLTVTGRSRGDWVDFEFDSSDVAQVIIPNDDDLGVTIINEVSGDARVRGEVRGEAFGFQGRSMCEFLGA